jgi:hypothetical protein
VNSSSASAKKFLQLAYSVLCKNEKGVSIMKETLWKNNRNVINDVPVVYVNFIIIVIVVIERKNSKHYFHITPQRLIDYDIARKATKAQLKGGF